MPLGFLGKSVFLTDVLQSQVSPSSANVQSQPGISVANNELGARHNDAIRIKKRDNDLMGRPIDSYFLNNNFLNEKIA